MRTSRLAIVFLVALFIIGLGSPLAAEKGDMQIRFGVLYSSPTDDLVDGAQSTELDSTIGFQGSFEYRINELIGIEPGISSGSYDLTVMETGFSDENGDTDLLALTFNLNFHFEQDSGLDLFLGPTIGYAFWDDISLDDFPDAIPTDDEFMFGLNFGLDFPFGSGAWAFNAGLNYLFVDVTPEGSSTSIGVNPIQLKVGLTYNF